MKNSAPVRTGIAIGVLIFTGAWLFYWFGLAWRLDPGTYYGPDGSLHFWFITPFFMMFGAVVGYAVGIAINSRRDSKK
jgi:hypothetical protein